MEEISLISDLIPRRWPLPRRESDSVGGIVVWLVFVEGAKIMRLCWLSEVRQVGRVRHPKHVPPSSWCRRCLLCIGQLALGCC